MRNSPKQALVLGVAVSALLLAGCTGATEQADPTTSAGDARAAVEPLDARASMTEAGANWYAEASPVDSRSRYDVTASVDPESGAVEGVVRATVPRPGSDALRFRYFAGLPVFDADASVGEVLVEGEAVEASLEASILTVPVTRGAPAAAGQVTVEVPFEYTLAESRPASPLAGLLGDGLDPADIGLLARHPDAMSLGHWMPLWIPEGRRADAVPDGYGDIGNFDAGDFRVSLEVPEGWAVVDGGVRVEETSTDGRMRVVSEGAGMRDFVVSVLREHQTETRELTGALDGVTISATSPAEQADQLAGVLDETQVALEVLSAAYGPYPWREFDVVSTPLGSSVGGMEWPGATWIESGLFGGGIPGLGDLDGLVDLDGLGDLGGLDGLGDLLGGGDTGLVLETVRAWTIAHEVAHSWWTVLVGNDSVEHPVVDEPLAQYASCLVFRESRDDDDAACRAHITTGYEQMRMFGEADAPADQATDEFDSSTQYGGVVYGKAAAFYLALEEEVGAEELTDALRALVEHHAFGTIGSDDVAQVLAQELGPEAGAMWARWIQAAHGDDDLGVEEGGTPGLGGLGSLTEGLLGEGDGLEGLGQLGDLGKLGELLEGQDISALLEQLMQMLGEGARER